MIRLTVVEGQLPARVLEFDQPVIRLGRDPANDVVLGDQYVSSHHGEIRTEGALLCYEDFETTNGSVLRRDEQVLVVDDRNFSRVLLKDGDELLLGDSRNPVVLRLAVQGRTRGPVLASSLAPEMDATHADSVGEIRAGVDREALLALHQLVTRLSSHLELSDLLPAVADCMLDAFRRANHVSVYLLDDESGDYRPTLSRGRSGHTGVHPVSRTVRDSVLSRGRALVFSETDGTFDASKSLHDSCIRAGMCAPLWDGRKIVGLVQVDCRGAALGAFDKRDLQVLVLFAHQAAMAIENARLHAGLRRTCEQSIRGLVRALEAKDEYTSGHSEAVAELCARVAGAMRLPLPDAETIRRAALLHDIGKIGIPFEVLNKRDRLTPEEFRILKTHCELGARILEPFGFLADLVPIVLHHHERWDGRGYPAGLAGEAIPLGARVLSVVDTYHALVSDRAYRRGVGGTEAVAELRRCAGTQFDPQVVENLAEVITGEVDCRIEEAAESRLVTSSADPAR